MEPKFIYVAVWILLCTILLIIGLYILANYNSLLRKYIRSELIRKNILVWLASVCFSNFANFQAAELLKAINSGKVLHYYLIQLLIVSGMALFVFNITWYITELPGVKKLSFRKKMGVTLFSIILFTIVAGVPINYFSSGGHFQNLGFQLLFHFYLGTMTGLIYVTMSYIALERQKKLNEKELELSKLQALKTKAELDALHSKINPHFLYNALNSIADLAVTDGKKARKMTIALADLFRYSINYSNHNYTTVKDEVAMAEVYLQIEKVRFEDQLTYSVDVDPELNHFLVPRFVLQPIVENAVKHGLKATGKLTEIKIEVQRDSDGMILVIKDNGPLFPEELVPGYGVKSIYDKLDLLFPGNYEIHFSNQPVKQVTIHIHKLMKDEPEV